MSILKKIWNIFLKHIIHNKFIYLVAAVCTILSTIWQISNSNDVLKIQQKVKEVPSILMLYASRTATSETIRAISDEIVPKLFDAAKLLDIAQEDPIHLFYYNVNRCNGLPNKSFTLGAGLPINHKPKKMSLPKGIFVKEIPSCDCASIIHKGSMNEMRSSWEILISNLRKRSDRPINHLREVYKCYINFDSSDNVTELQVCLD